MTPNPIGVLPRKFWEEQRLKELAHAIQRYGDANLEPLPEWEDEAIEIIERWGLDIAPGSIL